MRVRGEIANVTRAASGHWYFALKDDQAQARCVMFRARNQLLGWMPRDGDEVEVSAVVSLYEARGEFQLSVESMRRAGQGRLFEEFLRLKAQLAAEGLFAGERKRSAATRAAPGGRRDVDASGRAVATSSRRCVAALRTSASSFIRCRCRARGRVVLDRRNAWKSI